MIDNKPIPFVLQAHNFPNCSRDLNHAGQIMLPSLGHYFFNAFLVGVPNTRVRRTGEAMGCLVSSEEQHPATLQSFDACVIKKRVIPLCRLPSRSEGVWATGVLYHILRPGPPNVLSPKRSRPARNHNRYCRSTAAQTLN